MQAQDMLKKSKVLMHGVGGLSGPKGLTRGGPEYEE